MFKTRIVSVLALGLLSASAQAAGIPEGTYTGFVSDFPSANNPGYCAADRATVRVDARADGKGYRVQWEEQGRRGPWGEFCDTQLDADFRATGKENQWDVRFIWANNLIFGKATLEGDRLVIRASFSGGSMARFVSEWAFDVSGSQMQYDREIRDFGPSLRATGTLRRTN